jgi:hypothetical protein
MLSSSYKEKGSQFVVKKDDMVITASSRYLVVGVVWNSVVQVFLIRDRLVAKDSHKPSIQSLIARMVER